jgi:hypothetical protein
MKLFWKIKGEYRKITKDGQQIQATSLTTLINNIQKIASKQKISHISTIHKSFGLEFLPQEIVSSLTEKTIADSAIIAQKNNQQLVEISEEFKPERFLYQFIPEESTKIPPFNLSSNNPQIPENIITICQGTYQVNLLENSNNDRLKQQREKALNELELIFKHQPLKILHLFLSNSDSQTCLISLANDCEVLLTIQDLPHNLQETLNFLIKNPSSPSPNQLVTAYQQKYLTFSPINLISSTSVNSHLPSSFKIEITKGKHRHILEELIDNATEFLLISSYRMEDQSIVEKICKKAAKLPLGIWILTDFGDKVQDLVDANMDGQIEDNPEYTYSNEQKELCLQLLANTGIGFRSGKFHLKAYISEKTAYLGSCNLTGGSLNRNIETGITFQNRLEHQFLINYFSYLWENKTEAEFLPSGFQIQSLITNNLSPPISTQFLNQNQYEEDLTSSLQKFSLNPQGKIIICTRNFKPNSQQLIMLKKLPCQIYYSNFNHSDLEATKIPHLHSKIVIIGNQVAYLSTQDFAFYDYPLFDLTYKITDLAQIKEIKQQLKQL